MTESLSYIVLFSGHMIDDANRSTERFPEYKANKAKELVLEFLQKYATSSKAIASAASGGDIIFHEVCLELGIPSEVYLAEDILDFEYNSVSNAGLDWENRFHQLIQKLPVHILPEKYTKVPDSNVWEQTNVWMTNKAIEIREKEKRKLILLTIWNETVGGKAGGTEHMITVAKQYDCIFHNINPVNL